MADGENDPPKESNLDCPIENLELQVPSHWQTTDSESSSGLGAEAVPADSSNSSSHDSHDGSEFECLPTRRDCELTSSSEDEAFDANSLNAAKNPWRPLEALKQRELGCSNRYSAYEGFRINAGASLNIVKRLELSAKLKSHDGCVNALHFNQAGNWLASGSDDLQVVVWDWVRKKPAFSFESGHRSNVFQCKFMPFTNDSQLVTCARDGVVRLADISSMGSCRGTRRVAAHRGSAHKLALLDDSPHVFYSCGEDAAMLEIDLRQEKPNKLGFVKDKDDRVPLYSIHAHPFKSHEYCVSGRDQYIRVFDKRMLNSESDEASVKKFCPSSLVENSEISVNVTCAVYSWNGAEILGTYNDDDIYLFDSSHSDGADYIHKYVGHRNNQTVKGVNFYGPKSEFIISGSDCSNIFIWDKETTNILHYFHGDDGGVVNVLEPHPTCPILATSGLDSDVKIWTPTAKEPTKLEGIRRVIETNRREREDERSDTNPMGVLDSHMLFMLSNLRRLNRRRARPEGGDGSDSDTEDAASDDETGDEVPVACRPS